MDVRGAVTGRYCRLMSATRRRAGAPHCIVVNKNFAYRVAQQMAQFFSIVAWKTLDISQGSVATHLSYGGIFSDSIIVHFLLILRVK